MLLPGSLVINGKGGGEMTGPKSDKSHQTPDQKAMVPLVAGAM